VAKKPKSQYVCNNCGAIYAAWSGRCAQCGEWNAIVEQITISSATAAASGSSLKPAALSELQSAKPRTRLTSKMAEVDSVLGGGIVPGSVVLLAGQPGIGKSTLLLQLAEAIGRQVPVLYVSGEESAEQIALRASRLGVDAKKLAVASSTVTNDIAATIAEGGYELVIIDSIQTMACSEIASAAGSVSQISNSTNLLTAAAKRTNTALLIIGHVTKEGSIAGPKILEHMVDVVLQLEGDRYGGFKVLRAIKNRFGSTNEAGIFEMREKGLFGVENPSAALLAERQVSDGSIVLATMEGTRPLLVEVQALVNTTMYGYPKRAASGFDLNRLNLLIAVLERRTKLKVGDKDIYINIVGGMKITEPAADLAVCMAIGSAAKSLKLKTDAVVFGEIGLSGEVRHVNNLEKRVAEAQKMGFSLVVGPRTKSSHKQYQPVSTLRDALNSFLEK
jgi:DNA repair protein RadA/Sms